MRTYWLSLVFIVLIASLRLARSHRETEPAHHNHAAEPVASQPQSISFKEGKGLHVPAKTARLIGLRIDDVKEHSVTGVWRLEAQVYRTATEAGLVSTSGTATAQASGFIPSSRAALLQPGMQVTVTRDGESYPAQVSAIHPTPPGGSQAEVLLAITDTKGTLEQGTFVSANVRQANAGGTLSVPRTALLQNLEGTFVYTISGDRFVRTKVTVGVLNDATVEITEGLYAGDRVVVEAVSALWMAELQSLRGGKSCADGH